PGSARRRVRSSPRPIPLGTALLRTKGARSGSVGAPALDPSDPPRSGGALPNRGRLARRGDRVTLARRLIDERVRGVTGGRADWLFKSEPDCSSFADLAASPGRTSGWDGVRNFQARNMLRDDIKTGDLVLFYHSSVDPPAVAGVAEVVKEGHPDPTAFDPD